jgi:hypothetical protein
MVERSQRTPERREEGMKWGRIAVLAFAVLVASAGLLAVGGQWSGGEPVQALDLADDDQSARRDDNDVSPESVDDDDDDKGDGDNTRGDDGTNGGNNTGDRDNTRGDDGTNGGNNTGRGANTRDGGTRWGATT